MIQVLFGFASDKVLVTVSDKEVWFSHTGYGAVKAPIECLRLDYIGVVREFPDLELDSDWQKIAISRFKQKIKTFSTEDEIANYIISDLRKFGYVPEQKQKDGFRPQKIK